jgi:hypothetical protein
MRTPSSRIPFAAPLLPDAEIARRKLVDRLRALDEAPQLVGALRGLLAGARFAGALRIRAVDGRVRGRNERRRERDGGGERDERDADRAVLGGVSVSVISRRRDGPAARCAGRAAALRGTCSMCARRARRHNRKFDNRAPQAPPT